MARTHIDKGTPTRRYCVGNVASVGEIPSALTSASPHFMLFLALNASDVNDEMLRRVARECIDRGMAYLCVWGDDCGRVHDQFDLERTEDEPDNLTVTTTWHDDEPLSEALWYFANVAYPDDGFEADCSDWVALSVANIDWEREMVRVLVDENAGWPP
jgi:hypothetical protein